MLVSEVLNKKECKDLIDYCEEKGFTIKHPEATHPLNSCVLNEDDIFYKRIEKHIYDNISKYEKNINPKDVIIKMSVNKYDSKLGIPLHHDGCDNFSLTINLNNDYKKGGLFFPFYFKFFGNKRNVGEMVFWRTDKLFSFHEVIPPEDGVRYSLVSFIRYEEKEKKYIIKTYFLYLFFYPLYRIMKKSLNFFIRY
jgi:hypothetical protein